MRDEQRKTNKLRTKKRKDNKEEEHWGGVDKSLNLSLSRSLALFVFCWFWPQVACRSPRKLPASIQPYKLPHTPLVPVKMVTPIKAHSIVMN